jgi:N-dimethylarginine dimethylaminohydrolase
MNQKSHSNLSQAEAYQATIKMFGSEPEPAFETAERQQGIWGKRWGCNSDVGQIRSILVHRPGREMATLDPNKRIEELGTYGDKEIGWYWQGQQLPNISEMQAQHDGLVDVLETEGIEVINIEDVDQPLIKSCYARDPVVIVKGGAIISRMGPKIRHGEEPLVTRTLANLGMPILRTVHGCGMMAGGSFAWINEKTAVLARSIRVNDEGIAQVKEVLDYQGVELIVVDMCGYLLHIDRVFVMLDHNLAIVNQPLLPFSFLETLENMGIETISINPDDDDWIVNCLALRPRRVVMADRATERTREKLDKAGIDVTYIPYDKMQLNGGGIHCSTNPLVRDWL